MPVWIQVGLGVVAGGFLMLLVLVVGIKLAARRFLSKLASQLEELALSYVPVRIHLQPASEIEWKQVAAVQQAAQEVTEAGFESLGTFTIEEMGFVRLQGFVARDQTAYAVIYEHDKAGVWVDLVCDYEDGTSLTYANLKPTGMEGRPGHLKTFRPGSARDLVTAFLRERRQDGLKLLSASSFVTDLQQAYADETDWRNARGGPTREEVLRVAESSGQKVTPEDVERTLQMQRQQAMEGLREGLIARYLDTLAEPERARLEEGDLVVVHDKLPVEMLTEEMDTLQAGATPGSGTPRDEFARFNDRLEEGRRCTRLGTVAVPLEAELYLAPAGVRRTCKGC